MIERVTQQVWNWRWASNLSDSSNTKVTFPNSWKYHISSWSSAAFSSLEIVFPCFLKWVGFSPEDLHKATILFHNRKILWAGGWEGQYIISLLKSRGIPQYVIWNSRDRYTMDLYFLCSPSGERALISNLEHFQKCVVIKPERSMQIQPKWINPLLRGSWTRGESADEQFWENILILVVTILAILFKTGKN